MLGFVSPLQHTFVRIDGPSAYGKSCRVPPRSKLLRNENEDSATFDYRPFRLLFTERYNGCNSYVIGSQPRPSWEVEYKRAGGERGVGVQNATPPPRQCRMLRCVWR